MGMKLYEREREDVPGPGQYELRATVGEGPKWAVGTEPRGKDALSSSPGPG